MSETRPELRRELRLWDLVLFNIAAVAGIRWLAAAAHTGSGSVALWVVAALLFFVPSALAVSRLGELYPEEGGIYAWTKRSYGDWHGFLCGWFYWLSNLFYFPNLLLAGIGMAVFTFGREYTHLAEDRIFVVLMSVAVLWIALLTNLIGMNIGKWTENIGGFATYGAGLLLIVIGAIAWVRFGPATAFKPVPEWNWQNVNFWSQIAFAFGGLELGASMGGEIKNPRRNVPRAAWISGIAIAGFYILGTLAILALLAPQNVSVMTGLAQAGAAASGVLGMPWITPLLAGLISLGIIGQLGAWISGSARIPFAIGLDRYLPPAFGKVHPRWRTPHVAILTQGIACTVFLVAMQIGENLRTGYQLLVDMTVISYFIPFLYLFAASWKHGRSVSGFCGLLVTVAAIAFSFVPPAGAKSVWLFEGKLLAGCALLVLTARIGFARAKRLPSSLRVP